MSLMKKLALGTAGALLIALVASLFLLWHASHSNPYADAHAAPDSIPRFHEVTLSFTHRFDDGKSLPFMGGALIDIFGEGPEVVFIGGGFMQQDAVFEFKNGAFADITQAVNGGQKHLPDTTYGVSSMDMNGDGKTDLVLARSSGVYLLLNEGGTFSKARKIDIPFDDSSTPLSITLGDMDRDGFPDIFVSTYLKREKIMGQTFFNKPGYGSASVLLHNNGDGTFEDITREAGIYQVHNTFTAVFADLDDDGWLDLVVAQDTGHLYTWCNLGNNRFQDMPQSARTPYAYPMGLALGDVSNTGRLDIWASNVGPLPDLIGRGDLRADQPYNKWWILLRNEGGFKFKDVAQERKMAKYEFAWGGVFRDFNLDGLEDLVVSENYIGLFPFKIFPLPGRLLIQNRDRSFAPVEAEAGVVNRFFGISPLVGDFNGDGAPDIIELNLNGPARAFISEKPTHDYLKVRLPDAPAYVPSKVVVELEDGRTLTKWNLNGEGLCADQSNEIIVGLGRGARIRRVVVTQPSGRRREFQAQPNTVLVSSLRNN